MKPKKSEADHIATARGAILAAALPHVAFDGWCDDLLHRAIDDAGVDRGLAQQAFARGVCDLVAYFHHDGDQQMITAYHAQASQDLKIRERIALAIRLRIESVGDNRDALRAACSYYSVPPNTAQGARLIWQTCDTIWNLLDDQSTDLNWYTKRATLAGVYSSTVLYWLGDDSANFNDTWDFLDRRIGDVMKIEQAKAKLRNSPLGCVYDGVFHLVQRPDFDPSQYPGHHTHP